jgi:hypothetical protein
MKQPEYTEGPKALENFERGMKALFKAPKVEIVPQKKRTQMQGQTGRTPNKSGRLEAALHFGFG